MRDRLLNCWIKFAKRLPPKVIYFAANQLMADLTTHELSSVDVCDIKAMDALGIYSKRYNNFEKSLDTQ